MTQNKKVVLGVAGALALVAAIGVGNSVYEKYKLLKAVETKAEAVLYKIEDMKKEFDDKNITKEVVVDKYNLEKSKFVDKYNLEKAEREEVLKAAKKTYAEEKEAFAKLAASKKFTFTVEDK